VPERDYSVVNMVDPYKVLGVGRGASDEELRAAYRRLVQLHHPDHNGGSPESARRFEQIQEAYAAIREQRGAGDARRDGRLRDERARARPAADPDIESRLADLERQLREAEQARERARRDAREAAAQSAHRPSDEELGYVTTDDSFTNILDDARAEFAARLSEAREHSISDRVADLLDELATKLGSERGPRPRK
jgi:DnaJ-class molecular chaperone